MKLLLDHNLSPKLTSVLVQLGFSAAHVLDLGLDTASDSFIWQYAAQHGFCIVSKDRDFLQRSILRGHPPKFIWLAVGNCSTGLLRVVFTSQAQAIRSFAEDSVRSTLVLR